MEEEDRRGETTRERERRLARQGRPPAGGGGGGGGQEGDPTGGPTETGYNYRDPGRFGAPGYSYQVGDEFYHPGPEPPRDSPEWPAWKEHARAWRNYIGGRQQYVNEMVGMYGEDALEMLGIRNQKHEGQAGYRRIMQPGVIEELRRNAANWMRGSDAEIDPVTGLYMTGSREGGNARFMDMYGRLVDENGRPLNGHYGMEQTRAQYGANAVPGAINRNWTLNRPGPRGGQAPGQAPAPQAPQMQYGPNWKQYMSPPADTASPTTPQYPAPVNPAPTPTSTPTAQVGPGGAWGGYNPTAQVARPSVSTTAYRPRPSNQTPDTAAMMGAPVQHVPGARPRPNHYIRGGQIQSGLPRF